MIQITVKQEYENAYRRCRMLSALANEDVAIAAMKITLEKELSSDPERKRIHDLAEVSYFQSCQHDSLLESDIVQVLELERDYKISQKYGKKHKINRRKSSRAFFRLKHKLWLKRANWLITPSKNPLYDAHSDEWYEKMRWIRDNKETPYETVYFAKNHFVKHPPHSLIITGSDTLALFALAYQSLGLRTHFVSMLIDAQKLHFSEMSPNAKALNANFVIDETGE